MIQANELRIGNWVFFDSDSFPQQVRMESFAILFKYPERIKSIKPIPLTPEILKRCGFWKANDSDWRIISGEHNYVWEHDSEFSFMVADFGHDGSIDIDIKYLHQLQNLYFALTGNELQITL